MLITFSPLRASLSVRAERRRRRILHSFLPVLSDLLHSNPPPCISPLSTVATQNLHPPPPHPPPFLGRRAFERALPPRENAHQYALVGGLMLKETQDEKQTTHPSKQPSPPPPHLTPSISLLLSADNAWLCSPLCTQ